MYKEINDNIVVYADNDYKRPQKAFNFAFDTETITLIDGKVKSNKEIFNELDGLTTEEKRAKLSVNVWAWQVYDDINGFFMTNNFDLFLDYLARVGYKCGYCYNANFDFSQIDYKLLVEEKDKRKPHDATQKSHSRNQAFTYSSLHNNQGSRYSYKLWIPYKNKSRHKYVHAVEIHDFMKFVQGGLKKILNDMQITDENGEDVRKLTMDYQNVNIFDLSENDFNYCKNDVKGLFLAIKKFNEIVEKYSNNECHLLGKSVNVMTAGGLAKKELLRFLYPNKKSFHRIEKFQQEHPITIKQDKRLRENFLYRGAINLINKDYQGRVLKKKIYRYDRNSQYPYIMANMYDLVGKPFRMKFDKYLKSSEEFKSKYECVYICKSIYGTLNENFIPCWYNPKMNNYVKTIDEDFTHLIFEDEFKELSIWYDIQVDVDEVILIKKGNQSFKEFVEIYYKLKNDSKKDGNKTLNTFAKLILNSSYGKLSEKIERGTGHYEKNELNGVVHFVQDDNIEESKNFMNIFVGAKITSASRVSILKTAREICKGNVKENLIYIDTDSVHAFTEYDKADAYSLGGMKLEAIVEVSKYIAPKTYIDIFKVSSDGKVDKNDIEIHSKGLSTNVIYEAFKKEFTIIDFDKIFDYGEKFICLQALNVKGGKCLIPVQKEVANLRLRPNELINSYSNLNYINEL